VNKLITKKELAAAYGVTNQTLRNWLKKIPDLKLDCKNYLLPNQIEIIYKHLGEP
jgi:archaellum biogenesis ATPase FlaH